LQTFLPVPSCLDSAKILDKKRQFCQVKEAGQILDILERRKIWYANFAEKASPIPKKQPGWINHSAVIAWAGYEEALSEYFNIMWQYAVDFHKVKMVKMGLRKISSQKFEWPKWWAFPAYHANHRSRLLAKNPEHYSQFGWTEKPVEENYWPVDKNGLKPEIIEWWNTQQKEE